MDAVKKHSALALMIGAILLLFGTYSLTEYINKSLAGLVVHPINRVVSTTQAPQDLKGFSQVWVSGRNSVATKDGEGEAIDGLFNKKEIAVAAPKKMELQKPPEPDYPSLVRA